MHTLLNVLRHADCTPPPSSPAREGGGGTPSKLSTATTTTTTVGTCGEGTGTGTTTTGKIKTTSNGSDGSLSYGPSNGPQSNGPQSNGSQSNSNLFPSFSAAAAASGSSSGSHEKTSTSIPARTQHADIDSNPIPRTLSDRDICKEDKEDDDKVRSGALGPYPWSSNTNTNDNDDDDNDDDDDDERSKPPRHAHAISPEGIIAIEQVPELSYCAQIVIRLFEDRSEDPPKFRCEIR